MWGSSVIVPEAVFFAIGKKSPLTQNKHQG